MGFVVGQFGAKVAKMAAQKVEEMTMKPKPDDIIDALQKENLALSQKYKRKRRDNENRFDLIKKEVAELESDVEEFMAKGESQITSIDDFISKKQLI